jgi:predicted nucleic acid-binding protein
MWHQVMPRELACCNLKNRKAVLSLLRDLPAAPVATDEEVLFFIERRGLMGKGIGYVDAHFLAAISMTGTGRLWTRDKRLSAVAGAIGLAFKMAASPRGA